MVFADVVDSTALLVKLGPMRGEELRSVLSAAHRRVVVGANGSVIKDLGDGIMAVFGSVSDAIEATIGLQQATADVARRLSVNELAIRAGVSLGEATSEQPIDGGPLDWHGLPVVEAARLCSAASPRQILAADGALVFASGVERVSVGALTLKGLPAPVAASAVSWSTVPTGVAALPWAIATSTRRFVGRATNLDELRRVWKEASVGAARLALISGEPGIGKTRLAAELARLAHADGALVLFGRNDESGVVPHQPIVEVLRQVIAAYPDAPLPAGLGRLLPEHGDVNEMAGSDPELARLAAYDAAVSVLRTASGRWPMLVILDDMHWATPGTLALARHLRTGLVESNMLSVLTYRDTDVDRTVPFGGLLSDLHRINGVTRIRLGGLDAAAVEEMVLECFGDRVETGVVQRLVAQTEGNAFFVGAILDHFVDTGAPIGSTLPEGVRDVVGRRLDRVGSDVVGVLTTAAVIGAHVDVQLLAEVHGGERDTVFDAVDAATSARLLREGDRVGQLVFAHALIRQTLLDELPSTRRARLHQRVATALSGRSRTAEDDLADHMLAAVPLIPFDDAAAVARRVIDVTVSPSDVVRLVDRVLALADDVIASPTVDLAEISLHGGRAWFYRSERQQARPYVLRAVSIAERLGDDDLFVRAVSSLSMTSDFGVDPEQTALLERASQWAAPGSELDLHIRITRLMNKSFAGAAVDPTDEALAVVSSVDILAHERAVPLACFSVSLALLSSPAVRELARVVAKLRGSAPADEIGMLFTLGLSHLRCGDFGAFTGLADEIHEKWRQISRQRDGHPLAYQQEAILGLLRGQLDEARAHVASVARVAPNDMMFGAGCAMQNVQICLSEGNHTGALQIAETFRGLTPQPRFELSQIGVCRLRSGDHDGARREFDEAWGDELSGLTYDWARAGTLACLAELAVGLGDASRAQDLYNELLPWDNQLIVSMCTHVVCSANFALGTLAATLGRVDEARSRLAAALAWERSLDAVILAARTEAALASLG